MMPYILHVALLLTVCWLFYKLLLQKETYYKLNRGLLIACLAASFLLPLIPVPRQFSMQNLVKNSTTEASAPVIDPLKDKVDITIDKGGIANAKITYAADKPQAQTFNQQNVLKWLFWLYCCGVAAFAVNFLIQIIALFYQAYKRPVIRDGYYRIVELDGDKAPCSFGNYIFINPTKYDWETYNHIIMHEKVHIKQGHTVDLIIAELMLLVQWFNPFAWLYRKEMESNIEFLTDDAVIHDNSINPEAYQMGLLKVAVPNYSMRITTNYNQSLLKRRIMMMNAKRSNIHSAWKYLMLLPFMAIMICGLNKPTEAEAKSLTFMVKSQGNKPALKWVVTGSADTIIKGGSPDSTTISSSANIPQTLAANAAVNTKPYEITPEEIQSLSDRGVTADFIKGFKSIGYKFISADAMIAFNDNNINASFVNGFMNIGYADVSPATMVAFSQNNINVDFVKGFKNIQYSDLSPATMIAFDQNNIRPEFIKGFMAIGYKDISPQTMIMFDNSNIRPELVKGFKDLNYPDLSAATLIALDNNNTRPELIKAFKDIGYTDISPSTMILFDNNNIRAEFIKGFKNIGYPDLSPATMVLFDNSNIRPEFIKGFKNIGYTDLSPATMVLFDNNNIHADFIKSFKDIGFADLSPNTMLVFDNNNIRADYIKSFKAIGYKNLSASTIVAFNNSNITADYVKSFMDMGYKDLSPAAVISNNENNVNAKDLKRKK